MAVRANELLVENADRPCPNCGGRSWWVAVLADRPSGGGVDLRPAPMARCADCGFSARLDAEVTWDP